MQRLNLDERSLALLQPVHDPLARAVAALGDGPGLCVRVGDVPAPGQLDGDTLVLAEDLEAGPIHLPADAGDPGPPVDRWRRGMHTVLEALALRDLADASGRTPDPSDWRWLGAAIWAAAQAAPDLGVVARDYAVALASGDLGANPRGGAAVCAAWHAEGLDVRDQALGLLAGEAVSPAAWLRWGTWMAGSGGLARRIPVPVSPVTAVDIPLRMGPWRWQPVAVPANARGGRVLVEGDAAIGRAWATGGEALTTIAATAEGPGAFHPDVGGPVGSWDLASAEGFGQVFGARGVSFQFRRNGRFQLTFADGFVGPLRALSVAEEVGTSGTAAGRWRVAGPHTYRIEGLALHGVTMHGRDKSEFAVPAGPMGIGNWVPALQEGDWIWRVEGGELHLRGVMFGSAVTVRLRGGSPP